jgi:hypothetical protein
MKMETNKIRGKRRYTIRKRRWTTRKTRRKKRRRNTQTFLISSVGAHMQIISNTNFYYIAIMKQDAAKLQIEVNKLVIRLFACLLAGLLRSVI